MFIKLSIIGVILIIRSIIFSSEIIELFPETSFNITESLRDDVHNIGTKTSESVENRLDASIDKIVDKTNKTTSDGINSAKESKDLVSNEINKIDPIESINDLLKIQHTE